MATFQLYVATSKNGLFPSYAEIYVYILFVIYNIYIIFCLSSEGCYVIVSIIKTMVITKLKILNFQLLVWF